MLEVLERQYGSTALALLSEKVPRRLLPHVSLDRLKASAALDTILLDDGEELLLCIDTVIGDGSGRVLECVGHELAWRALNQGGVAKLGDLHGTVARLQAFLDHPFVDTPTIFELKRTDLGFALTLGVVGRPRATRVLRHLAVGAVMAAERSAHETGTALKLASELMADRATLSAFYRRSEASAFKESEPPPTSARRPAQSMRPPSLSMEVERILSSHKPAAAPLRPTPVPGSYRSSQPSIERVAQPSPERVAQPSPQRLSQTQLERVSEVQPVAPRTPAPDAPPPTIPAVRRHSKG
ncbi:MAG TPA: hypothetical protein VIW29_19990 [Polyangiaceae bacterium]